VSDHIWHIIPRKHEIILRIKREKMKGRKKKRRKNERKGG
jgi:hypothetical protein